MVLIGHKETKREVVMSDALEDVLRASQVAKRLNIARTGVYQLIDSGQLVAINVSTGQERPQWRITPDALQDFMSSRLSITAPLTEL